MDDGEVEVTLFCKVNILNGIEKWKNVTYKIEWFVDGKSKKSEDICATQDGEENDIPCPDGELHSRLPSTHYKIGQWVRFKTPS